MLLYDLKVDISMYQNIHNFYALFILSPNFGISRVLTNRTTNLCVLSTFSNHDQKDAQHSSRAKVNRTGRGASPYLLVKSTSAVRPAVICGRHKHHQNPRPDPVRLRASFTGGQAG